MGRPSGVKPQGTLIAGEPARLALTVKMSPRYMCSGSETRSPSGNAGVGVVGIATTSTGLLDHELAELTALRSSWGVADEDHIVRPIVARGRAALDGGGVAAGFTDLPAELCITAEGAFWSAFGPTVRNGRLDTDLLLTRTIDPLRVPAEAMLQMANGAPRGTDSTLNIR